MVRISIDEIRAVASLHRVMHARAAQRDIDAIVRQDKDAYFFARQELVDYLPSLGSSSKVTFLILSNPLQKRCIVAYTKQLRYFQEY